MPSIVTTRRGSCPDAKRFEAAGDEVHALAEPRPQLYADQHRSSGFGGPREGRPMRPGDRHLNSLRQAEQSQAVAR